MGLLVAGTKYRGEFEERLKKLMEEIKQNDDIILVSTPPKKHVMQPEAAAFPFCTYACVQQLVIQLAMLAVHESQIT